MKSTAKSTENVFRTVMFNRITIEFNKIPKLVDENNVN